MSEILSNIVVEQTSINFSPDNNNLIINPEAIQLNIFTGAAPGAGQSINGELLYNNTNFIDGVPFTSYANGVLTLGSTSNISITGGTNGYVLQTDGAGNLDWTAMTGGGGNGSPGGANTQIQYNDAGAFGGTSGFTFNKISNVVNMPGNLVVATNVTSTSLFGNVSTANQPNITSVGNLTTLTVVGTSTIQQAKEKVNLDASPSTGTENFNLLDSAIIYKTANASSNFTINLRGNVSTTLDSIMSNGQSLTCTFLNTNGANTYYANVIQVDGNTITPKWIVNGTPTSGTLSGIDSYTFNVIKTASSTFTVLGSKVGFV
jgi:hypothetical protein